MKLRANIHRFLLAAAAILPLSLAAQEQAAKTDAQKTPAADKLPAPEIKQDPPKPTWDRSASLGLTLTRGNSDSVMLTANVLAQHKWTRNELSLGADGTYGEVDSKKNAESVHGFGQYNRLISERAFLYGRVDALRDEIALIDYRVMMSPGAGYYFIKKERTTLSAEVGPGFIYEKQGPDAHGYMTLRVAERFEQKITDWAKLWQSLEYLPQVDRFKNYLVNAEIGIETALSKRLGLRTFAQDSYDNEPAPGRKKNDLKLVTAISVKF